MNYPKTSQFTEEERRIRHNEAVAKSYAKNLEANRERARKKAKAWYDRNKELAQAKNREKLVAARARDPERFKAYDRRRYEKDYPKIVQRVQARKRALDTRTPRWANQSAIDAVYREAKAKGLEVDHVIPLRGKLVSGLHVESNLQLLSRTQNARKGASVTL